MLYLAVSYFIRFTFLICNSLIGNCFQDICICFEIDGYNKKISKANKSRTLLWYLITNHCDLISLLTSDVNQKNSIYVANSTRLPYLDVRGTCISMESTPDAEFYSAAALLAMQSAVLATAIPSVFPLHAATPSKRMKIGSRGLHCKVAKHSSFSIPTTVGGDVFFHLNFALKVTHLLWKAPTSTNPNFSHLVTIYSRHRQTTTDDVSW